MASYEEEIVRLIAERNNRAILTVLNDAARPLPVTELADRLVARDATVVDAADYDDRLEQTLLTLHHEHLPRLADAGLVEYDRDENVVSYRTYASVDPEWLELELIDELLSRFRPERTPEGETIGVIEDRDAVYDYSRELTDRADDELFLIYTSDELLDEGCLPHAEMAIDRGVDFYAGSQNPDVRDFFSEHVPEATIWEPQLDWMNDPSQYPRVNRLILADRDTVMISLRDEPTTDGPGTETAMIGEGADNPLVVLVRELLGPRLDHLDYQSAHFRNDLPFEP